MSNTWVHLQDNRGPHILIPNIMARQIQLISHGEATTTSNYHK